MKLELARRLCRLHCLSLHEEGLAMEALLAEPVRWPFKTPPPMASAPQMPSLNAEQSARLYFAIT